MVDLDDVEHMVAGVGQDDFQVFLIQERHLALDERSCVGRGVDRRLVARGLVQPNAKCQGCLDSYGRLLADALNGCPLGHMGLIYALGVATKAGQMSSATSICCAPPTTLARSSARLQVAIFEVTR